MTVFNHPEVRERLQHFVPVAQDVQYMQYQRMNDEIVTFFDGVMAQAPQFNGRKDGTTRQGFYTFDANGRLFGAMNSRRAARLVRILEDAREAFAAGPAEIPLPEPVPVSVPRPPRNGAVARVITRVDPLPEFASPTDDDPRRRRGRRNWQRRNRSIGRDFMWFRADELAAIRKGTLPAPVVGRLLRYHLLDNVRGEPDPWEASHVELADFRSKAPVLAGEKRHMGFTGRFRLRAPVSEKLAERGYQGTVEGQFTFSATSGALLDLAILAEGKAWGRSQYTPGEPPGRFPLKVALVLTKEPRDQEIPPGMFFRGAHGYWNPGVVITKPPKTTSL